MKQKGFAPIIIIVLITLGIAGYFGYKQFKPTVDNLIGSSFPTPDPTVNWKTYTNNKARYEIKYPASWFITNNTISNVQSPLPEKGTVVINLYPADGSITNLDTLLDSILKDFKSMEGDPAFTSYESKTSTTVAEYPALKVSGKGYGGNYLSYLIVDSNTKTGAHISIAFQEGDLENFQSTIDQILSTFKFTDQSNTEEKFCGGFAGVSCPAGYKCQLDGKYPDAGGVCVKN